MCLLDVPASRNRGRGLSLALYSPKCVEEKFSEVPHSPGPMRQGFLCTDQVASWPVVHKTLIIPSGCIMAPPWGRPSGPGHNRTSHVRSSRKFSLELAPRGEGSNEVKSSKLPYLLKQSSCMCPLTCSYILY